MIRNGRERHSFGNVSQSSSSSSVSTYPRRRRRHVNLEVAITSTSSIYLNWDGSIELPSTKPTKEVALFLSTLGLVSLRTVLFFWPKYEAQEVTLYLMREDDSDESKCYEAIEHPDDTHFDDFDDSSDSEVYSAKGPSQTQESMRSTVNEGIYGRMRQAGKKVYNSWSIGKSLRKISNFTSSQNINGLAKTDINRGKWSSFKRRLSNKSNSTFYLSTTTPPNEPSSNASPSVIHSQSQPALSKTEGTVPDVRRLSVTMRPSSPPPPPPPPNPTRSSNLQTESKDFSSNETSIYGGSDIYDLGSVTSEKFVNRYSDMGLYENSQSYDSQSDHGSDLSLKFPDEPLYQFYTAIVNNFERNVVVFEEARFNEANLPEAEAPLRPSALDLVSPELSRTLWCQVPQVVSSRILDSLSSEKKKLQESKFELLTSEASYYKSLIVLEKHFMGSALLKNDATISKVDYKTLFGNVSSVRKCSEKVLSVLEQCWQESILMEGICSRVYQVAQEHFGTYVKYCANQVLIEKTMKTLKANNPNFNSALKVLHSSKECHGLSLYSFLLLPMQRITRMPLLLDAIQTKLTPSDSEYETCQLALALVNKIVHDCNEAAKKTERYEEMAVVSNILHFPHQIRPLPLHSASRWLIRSGQVSHINPEAKLTLSRKLTSSKTTKFTLFLFNDYLIIAKKKSEDHYVVHSYCQRRFAEMKKPDDVIINTKYLVQLTILENQEGKTQEMVFCCGSESSRERWINAFCPPVSNDPDEKVYSSWDCPQFVATHSYVPSQPDELGLQLGDVVNVERKLTDGWFYGERNRDGEKGWFPANHTIEIQSEHARARNLKQRHRLLVLSGNYLLQQQAQQQQQNRRSIFY